MAHAPMQVGTSSAAAHAHMADQLARAYALALAQQHLTTAVGAALNSPGQMAVDVLVIARPNHQPQAAASVVDHVLH